MRNYVKHKLTYLLIAFFLFPVFASGQERLVTLDRANAPLRSVLKEIEAQTSLSVVFNSNDIQNDRSVSIKVSKQPLNGVLDRLFEGTDVVHSIVDQHIVLRIQNGKASQQKAPPVAISGTVVDIDGEPLVGVSILVKGTSNGTVTDLDGRFTLKANQGDVLEVSYIGYANQEVTVSDGLPFSLTLNEDTKLLDEVVVTALGIKRAEKALSYNVQQIKNEELTTVKNANFMNSLAGKVAGVQINSGAGGPGSAAKVVMRGLKSISLSNNALYVIDGVPMNNFSMKGVSGSESAVTTSATTDAAADINPDDIESLSVLTGPSAAALYGYEGANGVVLITTKKGKKGKPSLAYSHSTTFSKPFKMPEFQNTYGNEKDSKVSWGGLTDKRYDPEKFFNTGTNMVNSLSLSTGSENNQTYLSVASTNATGILPNNDYDRLNFSFRNTTKFLDDRMTLDASLSYIIQENMNMTTQGQYFNPLPALYLFPRGEDFAEIQLYEHDSAITEVTTQFWPHGDQGLSLQNPYWIMYKMNRETKRKRHLMSAALQYKFTDWLNLAGRVNIDNANVRSTDKRHSGTYTTFAGVKGRYRMNNRDEGQIYADVIATVNRSIGQFSFDVNLGGSLKHREMESHVTEGDLAHVTNLFTTENLNREKALKMDDNGLKHQVHSVFANAEVGYGNFLYLTLTGRNDWDSSLRGSLSKERSFFYPSAGLSALFSEIVDLPSWFSYLKGRVSYTSVGTSYEPYLTREYYYYDDQSNQYTLGENYPNRYLKPEITNSFEAGIDMRFLSGKLSLNATYYASDTKNQTHKAELSAGGSGYKYIYVQAGSVRNSGLELALGYNNTWGDFGWASNYTFTHNSNKVKTLVRDVADMNGNPLQIDKFRMATLGSTGSPEVWLTEGGSMGDIYAASDFKRDINGYIHLDNVKQLPTMINKNEFADMRKIGSLLPDFFMGWRNSFSYKGVRLSALVGGRFGGKVVSNTQAILDRYGVSKYSAQLRESGGVVISGRETDAKDYLEIIGGGTGKSDFYVYNATNIRLQELSIEYSVPRKWLANKVGATVGLVANNLLMLYCKAPFDPETTPSTASNFYQGVDYFMQPSLRNIGFSLKLQF